jgi:MFS family permease
VIGRFINVHNKNKFFIPAMSTMILGLIMLFITRNVILVGISGFIMMSGNLVLTAIFNVKVRDYTPLDKVGHFQGMRMIFYVMIPMIIGPFIGARVISNSNVFYNDLGTIKPVPTPEIFIVSAIAVLFILVPLFIAFKNEKKVEEIA